MPRLPAADPRHGARSSSSMAEALNLFLKNSGLFALVKYPAIQRAWEGIIGPELSGRMRVRSFRRGVLEVAVESSALLTEVQFCRDALLEDLRRRVKKPFISRISFVVGPVEEEKDD